MSIDADGATRADAFRDQVAGLKIPDQSPTRDRTLVRVGLLLAAAGIVLGAVAYFMSHGTSNPLTQNDAITLGILGVSLAITGSAVFLRYSLSLFLRLWLLRLVHERTSA